MRIAEPTTTVTDVLLGLVTLWMCAVLAAHAIAGGSGAAWLWSLGFLASSAAALLGAASHGLVDHMLEATHHRLWTTTLMAIGLADVGLGGGAVFGLLSGGLAPVLVAALIVKLFVYAVLVVRQPVFRYAAYDYAITMAMLLVLSIAGLQRAEPGAAFLTAGIVVGFVGAGVQRSGFALHKHLNHNDLYHLIQLVAFWLLYRGALLLLGL